MNEETTELATICSQLTFDKLVQIEKELEKRYWPPPKERFTFLYVSREPYINIPINIFVK